MPEGTRNEVSRRRMLERIAAGAAVGWSAPVLSSVPTPAFAQYPPPDDHIPPTCRKIAEGTDSSGREFVETTFEDDQSGLLIIEVLKSTNATTVVPPFIPGTTDPVTVRSTKIDQTELSMVTLRGTEVSGGTATCTEVF
jgi:hypothetical protein